MSSFCTLFELGRCYRNHLKLRKVEHAEVMEEMELGPNGGLIFCMELLLENKGNEMKN